MSGDRISNDLLGTAVFSPCRTYRYRLERRAPEGQSGPTLAFIMMNPSTADERQDDQTIRMVRLFGRRHGYGRILIGNIFAFRSKDIGMLGQVPDPVGPDNDVHLERIMHEADRCYVAWGAETKLPEYLRRRWREVVAIADRIGCRLYCLEHLKGGHPRHPQILQYSSPDTVWRRPSR
jgi:hypothetical protein